MRADVFCNNNPIGTIDWTPDACGVQVNLDCAVCGNELLRCECGCERKHPAGRSACTGAWPSAPAPASLAANAA